MNTNGAAAKTGKKREHRGGQRKGGQTLSRNTAMLKRGRPQSVVQQHADISYTYTTDQKVRYSFSCKYCKKAKQTCKPGAPAKIPTANRLAEHLLYRCAKCPEEIKWPIACAHNSEKGL